jgi:hypothetical protein
MVGALSSTGSSTSASTPAALALRAARSGQRREAEAILADMIRESFSLEAKSVAIASDGYSLNSVNGIVVMADAREFFFKFHHEEGEELTLQELYRGELLRDAGVPIDLPVYVSKQIGRQLLLYRRRCDMRFAELCRELDFKPLAQAAAALEAQRRLDELTCSIYLKTLHSTSGREAGGEPIHQLFYHRLVERDEPEVIGGRARRFFWARDFDIAGLTISAAQLRSLRWRINGVRFEDSIEELLHRSLSLLRPASTARFGGVTAHGDAHNGNVWWHAPPDADPTLVLFDPAFAGRHVSALLAEVKATFHNVFAHPLWLYHPAQAQQHYRVLARVEGDILDLRTNWRPSPLRQLFLAGKAATVWRPMLQALEQSGLLPPDWRNTLRCALFCCPSLVKDPCAGGQGGHTPLSSALALAMAVRCGSEPMSGSADEVSAFLDSITPRQSRTTP